MEWTERYQILSPLSESFKGALFLAKDLHTQQPVVCRVLYHTKAEHYHLLQQITSPHVPRIFAIIQDADDTIVIEEYIPGETLEEALKKGKIFSLPDILQLTVQLCEALTDIHACGVIHRDIKPSNILLNGNRAVLIDFDAARQYHSRQQKDTVYMGTEGYAAPEQYGFAQTDCRSDIYALGVVLRELCGDDPNHPLAPIIHRCTAFDPVNRYASAGDILSDLERKKLIQKPSPTPFVPTPVSSPIVSNGKKAVKITLWIFFLLETVVVMIRMPHEITVMDYVISKVVYLSIVIFPAAILLNWFHIWSRFPLLRSPKIGRKIWGVVLYVLLFLVVVIALNSLAFALYSPQALEVLATSS